MNQPNDPIKPDSNSVKKSLTNISSENILKRIPTILGILAGSAVLLYILGFMIVEAYIFHLRLEGIFWFSDEFYARAGGKFILDILKSLLFTPYFFVLSIVIFYWMLPSTQIATGAEKVGKLGRRDLIAIIVLSIFTFFTSMAAINYGSLWESYNQTARDIYQTNMSANVSEQSKTTAWENDTALQPSKSNKPGYLDIIKENKKTFVYIDIFIPVAIILGILWFRLWRSNKKTKKNKFFLYSVGYVFIIYLSTIIMSYGSHVYDWKVVKLEESGPGGFECKTNGNKSLSTPANNLKKQVTVGKSDIKSNQKSGAKQTPPTRLSQPADRYQARGIVQDLGFYLIAQIGNNYLFLEKSSQSNIGRIVSSTRNEFPCIRFNLEKTYTLKRAYVFYQKSH